MWYLLYGSYIGTIGTRYGRIFFLAYFLEHYFSVRVATFAALGAKTVAKLDYFFVRDALKMTPALPKASKWVQSPLPEGP